MSYCSLEEAYGEDFAKKVGSPQYDDEPYYGLSRLESSDKNKNNTFKQYNQHLENHKQSFVELDYNKLWGEQFENASKLSPREYLKQSILGNRPNPTSFQTNINNEPEGVSERSTKYGQIVNSECNDFFYHLDTCKKCQHRLRKRVRKYIKKLYKQNQTELKSGMSGFYDNGDRELFTDETDDDETDDDETDDEETNESNFSSNKKTEKVVEGFQTQHNKNDLSAFLLMAFGIIVIYGLDTMKK